MIIVDPASALVKLFGWWRDAKTTQVWVRFLFSALLSYFLSFSGAMGTALISGHGFLVSLGYGILSGTIALFTLALAHPATRGFMLIVAKDIVEAYQKQQDQYVKIEPEGKK